MTFERRWEREAHSILNVLMAVAIKSGCMALLVPLKVYLLRCSSGITEESSVAKVMMLPRVLTGGVGDKASFAAASRSKCFCCNPLRASDPAFSLASEDPRILRTNVLWDCTMASGYFSKALDSFSLRRIWS